MIRNKSTETKVGIVSIIAFLLLVGGVMLGKRLNVTVTAKDVTMHFPHSGGIDPSSPVTVNGVKKGQVKSIKNIGDSVEIIASLEELELLRSDVTAEIKIQEITGGKKIDIYPGKSPEKFDPDDIITGSTPPDIADLVVILGKVSDDAIRLVRRLDTISSAITEALNDGTTVENIKTTFKNSAELTENINSFVGRNMDDLQISVNNLRTLTSDLKEAVKNNEPKVSSLLMKLDTTASGANELISNAKTTLAKAEGLIEKLDNIAYEVKTGSGLASKLIYDKSFAAEIEKAVKELRVLVNQIKQYGINTNVRIGTRP